MMGQRWRLRAHIPRDNRGDDLSFDKRDILKIGAAVYKEGIQAGPHPMQVEGFCEEKKIIIIREKGYSSHINRMVGSKYEQAKLAIHEYTEAVKGNEVHILVDMFARWEIPLRGGKSEYEKLCDELGRS